MKIPLLFGSLICLPLALSACSDGMYNPFESESERASIYSNDSDVRARRSERDLDSTRYGNQGVECDVHAPATDYTAENCPPPNPGFDDSRARFGERDRYEGFDESRDIGDEI